MPPTLLESPIRAADLLKDIRSSQVRWADINQRTVGKNLDLAVIEASLRDATFGLMSRLTDLEDETAFMDPHLSGILGKRFGKVITAPFRCEPCCPPGGDKVRAAMYAAQMQYAIEQIPILRSKLRTFSSALYHGRAAFEVHWHQSHFAIPGTTSLRFVPVDIVWVPPRNLSFGPQRELRHINPDHYSGLFNNQHGFALDELPGKFLTWTPQQFCAQPEREGLGPRCLYWSFFKRISWRLRLKLTELFGIPWRIVTAEKGATVGDDQLRSAREAAQALGADTTAQLAPGMKLDVVLPDGNVGELFSMTSKEIDDQLSKLVLGNAGTTDPKATGMGANTTESMQVQEDAIVVGDFYEGSEAIRDGLARPMMRVNHGDQAAAEYTPYIVLDGKPRNRRAELDTKKVVVDMGIPVAIREIREAAGVEEPEPGEETIGGSDPMAEFAAMMGLPAPGMPPGSPPTPPGMLPSAGAAGGVPPGAAHGKPSGPGVPPNGGNVPGASPQKPGGIAPAGTAPGGKVQPGVPPKAAQPSPGAAQPSLAPGGGQSPRSQPAQPAAPAGASPHPMPKSSPGDDKAKAGVAGPAAPASVAPSPSSPSDEGPKKSAIAPSAPSATPRGDGPPAPAPKPDADGLQSPTPAKDTPPIESKGAPASPIEKKPDAKKADGNSRPVHIGPPSPAPTADGKTGPAPGPLPPTADGWQWTGKGWVKASPKPSPGAAHPK